MRGKKKKSKPLHTPSKIMSAVDNSRPEVAAAIQKKAPPEIEMIDQVPESTSQAHVTTGSKPATAAHSEHDTPPPTTDALERLTLVSQVVNAPASPPTLMPSILAPPHSPTTELDSLGNEICQLFCFSKLLTT